MAFAADRYRRSSVPLCRVFRSALCGGHDLQVGGGYQLLEGVLLVIAIVSVAGFALAALLAPKAQAKGRSAG
jgi:hypothetical protein